MHRLLIVEDDPATRAEAAEVAAEEGLLSRAALRFEIEQALEHWRPDLVLLDIVMPEVEGMEVLRLLAGAGAAVPVVLLSAFRDYLEIAQRLAGASDVLIADILQKPYQRERLRQALRAAMTARLAPRPTVAPN